MKISKGEKELEEDSSQLRKKIKDVKKVIDISSGSNNTNAQMILEGLNKRFGRENGVNANQMEIEESLLMKENSRMTDRQYNIIRESMQSAVPPLYRLKEKEKEGS